MKKLVLNEPLALGSNECGNYVAIFTCRWFSILFHVVVTFLTNGCRAAFAVIQILSYEFVFSSCQKQNENSDKEKECKRFDRIP